MIVCLCIVGDSIPNNSFSFFYRAGGWDDSATLVRTEQATYRSAWRGFPASGQIWANFCQPQFKISDLETQASALDALINSNYAATGGRPVRKYVLAVKIGTNNSTASATLEAARIRTYCLARQAAGWDVILCPNTSGNLASFGGASADTTYVQPLNALFASYGSSDGVAGVVSSSDAVMYGTGAYADTTYFSDGIHPTKVGHRRCVQPFLTALDTLLVSYGKLAMPTGLLATSGSAIQIDFTTPAIGAVFRLYRNTVDNFQTAAILSTITAPTSPTVTTFDDTGVSGTPYYFWVTRYNGTTGEETLPTLSVTATPS